MKNYIISITTAALFSISCNILIPKNWQKYSSLLTGVILLSAIISPILHITNTPLPTFDWTDTKINEYETSSLVYDELTKRVEEDIKTRLIDEFNVTVNVKVIIKTSADKIDGVDKIYIYSNYNNEIKNRLSYIYGCNNIEFINGE